MGVRHRLRSAAAALGITVLVSLGLLAAGAGAAAAQTTTPETPCLYTVSPTTLPTGGGTVTVKGSAPGSSVIRVYADGIFITAVGTDPIDGSFEVSFHLDRTSEVAITIDDYPATGCTVDTANQGANQGRGSLPRTGSDHVESTVLIALFLVAVGAVLVVAVRRHDQVSGRLRSKRH
jgi:hypothetical protein